jgi:hypothetical protein
LHAGADRPALGQGEVIAHAELVAVVDDRRAGQAEHQAEGQLDAPAVAVRHWRQPASDATLIEAHVGVRRKCLVAFGALMFPEAAEIQLVVVAQEMRPLTELRQIRQQAQTADQRFGSSAGEREEGVLVGHERE